MGRDTRGPRRHPSDGGYARGEETRARIIATALRVFGEQGYLQASTRGIAADARVNPPALQYYFGSKEGLHRACAQHIIDRVSRILTPALGEAREALRAHNPRRARAALIGLLDAMADGLLAAGAEHHIVRCIRALIAQLVDDFAELEAIHPNVRRHIDVNRDKVIYCASWSEAPWPE